MMTTPLAAIAIARGDCPQSLVQCCIEQLGHIDHCHLGLLYITPALIPHCQALFAQLQQHYPHIHWTGSTVRRIATQHVATPMVDLTIMALPYDGDDFRTVSTADTHSENPFPTQFVLQHAESPQPSASNTSTSHTPFITGLINSCWPDAPLFHQQAIQQTPSSVAFAQHIAMSYAFVQDTTPIGPLHAITRHQRNVVITLDGHPAFSVLKEEAGELLSRDIERLSRYICLGFAHPSEDKPFSACSMSEIDEQFQLIAAESTIRHTHLTFCRRDGNSAMMHLRHSLSQLKQSTFSCIGLLYLRAPRRHAPSTSLVEERGLITHYFEQTPCIAVEADQLLFQGEALQEVGMLIAFGPSHPSANDPS